MFNEFDNLSEGVYYRDMGNGFGHLRIHYTADPLKRGDWKYKASALYGGIENPRWQRENEINYDSYVGQRLWPSLCGLHSAEIDVFDGNWSIYRSIDQGIRHPTVCLWVAVNAYGDRHVFREFYSVGRSIAENCRLIRSIDSDEPIVGSIIDPSTRKRSEVSLTPLIEVYAENGIFAEPADNSFSGYDRVNLMLLSTLARKKLEGVEVPQLDDFKMTPSMLKEFSQNPCLTFDTRFAKRAFTESCNLRWRESKTDSTQIRQKEKPVDVKDDGPDCVRYACQTNLAYSKPQGKTFTIHEYWKLKNENRKLKESYEKIKERAYV